MKVLFKLLITVLIINFIFTAFANEEYMLRGEYKDAYISFNKSLKENATAQNYLNMCKITYKLNDNKTAKYYCNRALDTLDKEKEQNNELRANILSMMGNIYSNTYHNTSITFDYYFQARKLKEQNSETDMYELALLYMNLSNAYKNIEYYLTKKYIDKTLKIVEEKDMPKYRVISAFIYNNSGLIEIENKNYEKSKEYFEKALSELNKSLVYKDVILEGDIYKNLGDYYKLYAKHKNTNEAKKYYTMANNCYDSIISDVNDFDFQYTQLQKEELKELRKKTDEKLKEYPYDIKTLSDSAYLYLTERQDKEAQENIDTIINTYAKSAYRYLFAADAYSKAYRSLLSDEAPISYAQKSSDYLNLFLKNVKEDSNTNLYAGIVCFDAGKRYQAEQHFKKYIETNKGNYMSYKKTAYIYLSDSNNLQNTKKAAKYLELSIKNGNKDIKDINELWHIYNTLNLKEKAYDLYKKYNLSELGTQSDIR